MKKTILIVDDEKAMVSMIALNLKGFGFNVIEKYNGKDAIEVLKKTKVDAILLDIMMPELSGTEVCKEIKANPLTRTIPVILLTAKSQIEEKIDGLNSGADDYITKPFNMEELKLRIDACIRQVELIGGGKKLEKGNVMLLLDSFQVYVSEKKINLTLTEFRILHCLLKNKGLIVPREVLLMNVLEKEQNERDNRTMDVHIRNLRKKLQDEGAENFNICTKRGIGFYIE